MRQHLRALPDPPVGAIQGQHALGGGGGGGHQLAQIAELMVADENEDGADRNYSYLLRKVVPWMETNGVPAGTINRMIIENPRRIFTA